MKKTSNEQNKLNLNLSERGSRSGEKGKITVNNFSYTNRSILEITELKIKTLIRNDLEIHETRNMSDRNRRFGASCAIIKVT